MKEAINIIRQLWYKENNIDTTNMDKRELAMHVGKKTAYISAMNALSVAENHMSDKGYEVGDLKDIPEWENWKAIKDIQ